MNDLTGQVALITGAGRGIGRAIARTFAEAGADLVLLDICRPITSASHGQGSASDLDTTAREVRELGRKCLTFEADVRAQDQLDAAVSAALEHFGRIDVAVANAGIAKFGDDGFWTTTEQQWQDQLDVNLSGVWHTAKAVAPHMIERGTGSIVLTASTAGLRGDFKIAAYVAAKHGVIGFMKCAALELGGHGVRVNAIAPGTVDTPMNDNQDGRAWVGGGEDLSSQEYLYAVNNSTALKGTGALPPQSAADAALWLASGSSRYVTGTVINVDAGYLLLPGYNHAPVREGSAA